MKKRNRVLFWSVLIILVVTLMPGDGKIAGNYLDKLVHWAIFFFLGLNISYKFHGQTTLTTALLWAVLGGLLTEVIQQFIPGRNMDMYDGIADTLGVMVGYFGYVRWQSFFDRGLKKLGA